MKAVELTSDDLELIAAHGSRRSYPKNSILISEGDSAGDFYIVVSGQVRVYSSNEEGREVILNSIGPGGYFGELSVMDDAPRSASVVTLEPTQVVAVSKAALRRCLAEHPDIALRMIRALSQRVRALTTSLRNMALLDVYGRLVNVLMDMARQEDGALVIARKPTQQELANMVGASREMVSRILKELANAGYLEVQGRRLIIHATPPAHW